MRRNIRIGSVLCLCACLVMGIIALASAQPRVRAKIGIRIQSGDSIARAKAKHRITVSDLLRIYVIPEEDSYVYIVHADKKKAELLTHKRKTEFKEEKIIISPSGDDFYQFDGKSKLEYFTIVVSPNEIEDLLDILYSGEVSYKKWIRLEKVLIKKSKINISKKSKKPFAIAGNVRSIERPMNGDSFLKKLITFSGKSLLVKKYEFLVRK